MSEQKQSEVAPSNAADVITPEQARRAFYVDFEGRKKEPASGSCSSGDPAQPESNTSPLGLLGPLQR